jgi:hypothetical protein
MVEKQSVFSCNSKFVTDGDEDNDYYSYYYHHYHHHHHQYYYFYFHSRALHPVANIITIIMNTVYATIFYLLFFFIVLSVATCFVLTGYHQAIRIQFHQSYWTYNESAVFSFSCVIIRGDHSFLLPSVSSLNVEYWSACDVGCVVIPGDLPLVICFGFASVRFLVMFYLISITIKACFNFVFP